MDVIEESEIIEDVKNVEKAKVLNARKEAFGTDCSLFPPWFKR